VSNKLTLFTCSDQISVPYTTYFSGSRLMEIETAYKSSGNGAVLSNTHDIVYEIKNIKNLEQIYSIRSALQSIYQSTNQFFEILTLQGFVNGIEFNDTASVRITEFVSLCVLANKGDTVYIDNPERSLHYANLAVFTEFLVTTINRGVKILLQSDSHNVFLQIRIAIKEGRISHNDVLIQHISRNDAGFKAHKIHLDKNGECSQYPDGLFDSIENQLFKLI